MDDQNIKSEEKTALPAASVTVDDRTKNTSEKKSDSKIPLIIFAVILVLAGLIYLFIRLSTETTGKIRDISLILWVLESVVTVTALVVLVVQTAKLVNFLKYEIDPILHTTQKTARKLSGTVSFLCENAVEPTKNAVAKVSGVKAAASGVLGLFKKSK